MYSTEHVMRHKAVYFCNRVTSNVRQQQRSYSLFLKTGLHHHIVNKVGVFRHRNRLQGNLNRTNVVNHVFHKKYQLITLL